LSFGAERRSDFLNIDAGKQLEKASSPQTLTTDMTAIDKQGRAHLYL
jgi:hypothetical protein